MIDMRMFSAAVLCAGLAAACGGGTGDAASEQPGTTPGNGAAREEVGGQAGARPEPISVDGCLTEANGRFVLTQLEREGGTATETYQLTTNAPDDLRQHVGREVRIAGEAAAARVAEVRESTPPGAGATSPAGTSGQQGGAEVSTESTTRLEMRQLAVSSVTPTGDECPTAAGAQAR
jgi:hypothetical protein